MVCFRMLRHYFAIVIFYTKQSVSGQCLAISILLPISCKSVQPVPARVEELVSPIRQSSSGGATDNPPFPQDALASTGK